MLRSSDEMNTDRASLRRELYERTLDLRREIGIPHTLAELGVKEGHLDKFAEMAAVDPTAGGNPVKAGVPEMRKMYEAAIAGRL